MKSNQIITNLIKEGSSVLDLGCGNGSLLELLISKKKVRGMGVEIDSKNIQSCLEKGIDVIEQNIDKGLKNFRDDSYDSVLLSETIQVLKSPEMVLLEISRIGKSAIVTFPNFAHWKSRFNLLIKGKMPKTRSLPDEWFNTKNIHLCTIKDFEELCDRLNISIDKRVVINNQREVRLINHILPNFFGELVVYQISRNK